MARGVGEESWGCPRDRGREPLLCPHAAPVPSCQLARMTLGPRSAFTECTAGVNLELGGERTLQWAPGPPPRGCGPGWVSCSCHFGLRVFLCVRLSETFVPPRGGCYSDIPSLRCRGCGWPESGPRASCGSRPWLRLFKELVFSLAPNSGLGWGRERETPFWCPCAFPWGPSGLFPEVRGQCQVPPCLWRPGCEVGLSFHGDTSGARTRCPPQPVCRDSGATCHVLVVPVLSCPLLPLGTCV